MAFVNREGELGALDEMWRRRGAQFLVLYGRRRIGKTALLLHWARKHSHLYWVAKRTSAANLLADFSQALYRHENEGAQPEATFSYASWGMALERLNQIARGKRRVFILDEFPYAVAAEPALTSLLQAEWDQRLQESRAFLVLSGSRIGMMAREVLSHRAPLFGRATGTMLLQPLPLKCLKEFFPRYSPVQLVTVHAILGGVPTYLQTFDDGLSISENIRRTILSETTVFRQEPVLLIQDEVTEPRNHLAILQAIGQGARTQSEIARLAGVDRAHTGRYLSTLQQLQLVRRDIPATERNPAKSRKGHYTIADPYLRFHFRFLSPRMDWLEYGRTDRVLEVIQSELPGFVGSSAFEPMCRQWLVGAGDQGKLPFVPERVGGYWDRRLQLDVVALSWAERSILLGEAKWTERPMGVNELEDLIRRSRTVVPGHQWHVQYALFSRSGFTRSLRQKAKGQPVMLVSLKDMI